MKRFPNPFNIMFVVAIMLFGTVALAHAGWIDAVKDYTVSGLVSVLFAIIAGIFGKKFFAFKAPLMALIAVYYEYAEAKKPKSEGGKELTQEEWNGIFGKMTIAVTSIIAIIPQKWLPKKE